MTISTMKKEITPEKMIKALHEMNLTQEEKLQLRAHELGESFGKVIASVIIQFLASTIIWAILVFILGLNLTWLKVFGAYFLFNFIKNIIVRSFKNT